MRHGTPFERLDVFVTAQVRVDPLRVVSFMSPRISGPLTFLMHRIFDLSRQLSGKI
jgi:hypothetical protein